VNKSKALSEWRGCYLPIVRGRETDGVPDYPARNVSWSYYTDGLCKAGEITLKQYESWSSPRECSRVSGWAGS